MLQASYYITTLCVTVLCVFMITLNDSKLGNIKKTSQDNENVHSQYLKVCLNLKGADLLSANLGI